MQTHIKSVAKKSDMRDLTVALDRMHATVVNSLPNNCGVSVCYASGRMTINADFRAKEHRDVAVSLIESGAIPALHGCVVTTTAAPVGKNVNRIAIRAAH